MYKNICIVVILLGSLALVTRGSNGVQSPLISPVIVARVALPNQTAPIPNTTMFTPSRDGVFRVSVYLAMTAAGNNGGVYWTVTLKYQDEAGQELMFPSRVEQRSVAPYAYALNQSGDPGNPVIIKALAGTPVSYQIDVDGTPGGTYQVFIVVEKLG